MNVEQIPANELVVMTPELYQEFCQGGCVPACHFTNEWINIGDQFHLCTINQWNGQWNTGEFITAERDVMLSASATAEQYNANQIALFTAQDERYKEVLKSRRGGCFRVNGKIVL